MAIETGNMAAGSGLNLFFDVDFTLISIDGSLRPGVHETFRRLIADGHRIFIWSGVGMRTDEIRKLQLEDLVSGIYVKPLEDFEAGLLTFGVDVYPDFVIDDFWHIVNNWGGVLVNPYYFPSDSDQEMELIYRIVNEYADRGHSEHPSFLPGKNGNTAN